MRIAYVEDDPDLCEAVVQLLRIYGHEADYFIRGRDLLEHLARADETFDLLITDYYVPDVNGVDLVKLLRQKRPGLPVLLLTGSREPTVQKAASRLEDCEVLYKPIDMDDLVQRIERHAREPVAAASMVGKTVEGAP
jgi:two-component system phosphoglycerate transport system response regulator PgtA